MNTKENARALAMRRHEIHPNDPVKMAEYGRKGGRPLKQTKCGKCGEVCMGAKVAKEHCK